MVQTKDMLIVCQVHRAMSHDGRQLAVKVQHVGLRDTCAADTVIVEAFVKGLRWVFPDFNYQWLVDELKESVPKVLHAMTVPYHCTEPHWPNMLQNWFDSAKRDESDVTSDQTKTGL